LIGPRERFESALPVEVEIVIVNWNSRSLLRECVVALDRSTIAERLSVCIVDNASTDGSADGLGTERVRATLLRNSENRGFAAACNQGARIGQAPLIFFLNPDVRIEPDTVERAVNYLTEPCNSRVGILGIQLLDANGTVWRSCARAPTMTMLLLRTMFLDRLCPQLVFPHFLAEWDHRDTRPVDQVMGAALMIRRPLFEKLGGFDERFFVYYEDVDLCEAARKSGWNVTHFAGARAIHVGGGTTQAVRDRRLAYEIRSRLEYAAKHHGRTAAFLLGLFIVVLELPIRLVYAIMAWSPRDGRLVLCAMVLLFLDFWGRRRRLGAGW